MSGFERVFRAMAESHANPPASTFVIRIWREWTVAREGWRGQIDHVQSGKSCAFLELPELLDFIRSFDIMTGEDKQDSEQGKP